MSVYGEVLSRHRPSDDSSWAVCVECRQYTHPNGFGESFPVWPCDAVRVVVEATGAPLPEPLPRKRPVPFIETQAGWRVPPGEHGRRNDLVMSDDASRPRGWGTNDDERGER